jgi:hypothetical protein
MCASSISNSIQDRLNSISLQENHSTSSASPDLLRELIAAVIANFAGGIAK